MTDVIRQIIWISKTSGTDRYHCITHVGGLAASQWKLTLNEAIEGIEEKGWRFYVQIKGSNVWVLPAVSPAGTKYLKTAADSSEPIRLLSLPEFPRSVMQEAAVELPSPSPRTRISSPAAGSAAPRR